MLFALLLTSLLVHLGAGQRNATVDTVNGKVEGIFHQDERSGAKYYAFTCIPYAKAPIGDLRFEEPVPAENWNGTLRRETCPACPQITFDHKDYVGSEDCLTINVYTPRHPDMRSSPLPIVAYIHASDWRQETAGDYKPSYYVGNKHAPVILVTFNYRLGPFGFLSTGDRVVSGNNGLKDQVMALKWIRRNIGAFGGDPYKVTIVGSSTGAASVRYHMLSQKSKGLFVGAIAQSGNELNSWSWQTKSEARHLYKKLSKDLGCEAEKSVDAIKCMKNITAKDIILSENKALQQDYYENFLVTFKPVTEEQSDKCFLCKDPINLLRDGEANDVPLIIGHSANEGALKFILYLAYMSGEWLDEFTINLDWVIPTSWNVQPEDRAGFIEIVRQFYNLGDARDYVKNFLDLISDSQYLVGHNRVIELLQIVKTSPVYEYVNSFKGDLSWTQYFNVSDNIGPSHYDEELIFFDFDQYFPEVRTARNKAMTDQFLNWWINFVYTQNPNPPTASGTTWYPLNGSSNRYLNIIDAQRSQMETNFDRERSDFWRVLAHRYSEE